MAQGSLNLFVGKKDFLDRINKIESTMTKLEDVIARYGEAKKNLDQFMGDTDDNYEAMIARIDANVKAAKKSHAALQEAKAGIQDTVDKMENMGNEVKETITAGTEAAINTIDAAIKVDAVL